MNKNVTNSFWHMYKGVAPVLIYVQIIIDLLLPHPVKSGLATAKKYNGAGRQFVQPRRVWDTAFCEGTARSDFVGWELVNAFSQYQLVVWCKYKRLMKSWFKTIYHANLIKATNL